MSLLFSASFSTVIQNQSPCLLDTVLLCDFLAEATLSHKEAPDSPKAQERARCPQGTFSSRCQSAGSRKAGGHSYSATWVPLTLDACCPPVARRPTPALILPAERHHHPVCTLPPLLSCGLVCKTISGRSWHRDPGTGRTCCAELFCVPGTRFKAQDRRLLGLPSSMGASKGLTKSCYNCFVLDWGDAGRGGAAGAQRFLAFLYQEKKARVQSLSSR